jgi:cytochrome c5
VKRCILLTTFALVSGVLAQNTAYQPDPDWRVPQAAVAKPNPLASKPEAAAGGKKPFLRNCTECHGQDGSGLMKKHAADCSFRSSRIKATALCFGRLPTEIPIAACHLLASFPSPSAGNLYFSFAG